MDKIFTYTLIHATLRGSIPILYAAMACAISRQANVINIGVEGIMLISSFFAIYTSYMTGSWFMALLVAIVIGLFFSGIMIITSIKFKANIAVIGVLINLFGIALSSFLMQVLLAAFAYFADPAVVPLPILKIDGFKNNPVLLSLFSGYSLLEILAPVVVFLLWFFLYRTVWGLRLRSVGLNELAAQTAGINVNVKKIQALLISGAIAGVAGAHLSLGYVNMFTTEIVNGRGFMGFAAMNFGRANPLYSALGCLIFGFFDAVGARTQLIGIPSQFMLSTPHIVTVLVLVLSNVREKRRDIKRRSAKTYIKN